MRYGEWHDVPYHSMCGADGTALTDLYSYCSPSQMQWRSPHMRNTRPRSVGSHSQESIHSLLVPLLEDQK